MTLFFSAGSQELLLVPDTFITQHTLGSVSSIQDLEAFKGSPQPERSSKHGSQTRPRAQRGEATSSQVCCLWQHGAPRGGVRHRGSSSDPAVAKQAGGCTEDQESEGDQATTSPKGWEPPCPCPLHVHVFGRDQANLRFFWSGQCFAGHIGNHVAENFLTRCSFIGRKHHMSSTIPSK